MPAPEPFAISLNNGTIANTGVFQTALSANALRKGAVVYNGSSHTLEAVFTPATSASATQSIPIAPGATMSAHMDVPGGVYQGEIALSGTSADAYVTWEFTRE